MVNKVPQLNGICVYVHNIHIYCGNTIHVLAMFLLMLLCMHVYVQVTFELHMKVASTTELTNWFFRYETS